MISEIFSNSCFPNVMETSNYCLTLSVGTEISSAGLTCQTVTYSSHVRQSGGVATIQARTHVLGSVQVIFAGEKSLAINNYVRLAINRQI